MSGTIALGLGAALLSHLLLALLWLGWARPWLIATLLAAALVAWAFYAVRQYRKQQRPPAWTWGHLAFVPFLALYLVHALAPETTSDAIAYHLGLPAAWLRAGGAFTGRTGFFEAIPHGLETLFTAAIALGGGISFTAAKLVHFTFLLATLPLMTSTARRFGFDGRAAALIYFASPVVAMAGTAAYNDAAVAFYALLTFYLLVFEQEEERWRGARAAAAGIAAGFCYAIKMSGGVVTIVAALVLLKRRSLAGLAAIAFMVMPWLAHSWWLTENPVAPMLLAWFPSPALYPATVQGWTDYVRSYGTSWSDGDRLREVLAAGARTQGLLGPVFAITPLVVIAGLARGGCRAAKLLLAAAAIASTAWLLNAGTRFLMPAAVFVALAMAASLPPRLVWTLAAVHAVLSWPDVLDRYTPASAWRLSSSLPWRAALRLETEAEYLRRVSPPYRVAQMVNRHTPPGARILDLAEAPRAYTSRELFVPWQHTPARRAAAALVTAHSGERDVLYLLRGSWPAARLRSIRFEQFSTSPDNWSIMEARLRDASGGTWLFPSREHWELDAQPNPWDAPLAFDRNQVSAWRTWQPRRNGMYLEIRAASDERLLETSGVELVLERNEAGPRVRVTGTDAAGRPVVLAERLSPAEAERLNRRAEAMRYVRRESFDWILTTTGAEAMELIGRSLVDEAPDWGVEQISVTDGVYLLRIAASR